MKVLLFCLLMTMLYYSSNRSNTHTPLHSLRSADTTHQIDFKTEIQPIFASHCTPCHFTGGKMYDRLPFDKAQTIVDHEPGIFKRIKNEKETALIREFIAQQKKG